MRADLASGGEEWALGWRLVILALLVAVAMLPVGCGGGGGDAPADGGAERQSEEQASAADRSGKAASVAGVGSSQESEGTPRAPREEPTDAPAEEEPEAPSGPETARVDDGIGALSLTVPASWTEVIRGAESETGNSWSAFAGETVASSVTAAPSLYGWGNENGAGVYAAVSRSLADDYTDDELVNAGPNEMACQLGSGYDLSRGPYKGLVQEWQNCGESGTGILTVAASPEGRECVLLMQFAAPTSGAVVDKAQRDTLLDGFEVDCSRLP